MTKETQNAKARELLELARGAMRARLVLADVLHLEATLERAVEIETKARAEGRPELALLAMEVELVVHARRIHLAERAGLLRPPVPRRRTTKSRRGRRAVQ